MAAAFNEALATMISDPAGKTNPSYSILTSVTAISQNAFRNNPHLTSVYIFSTVTTIESYGFYLSAN